MFCTGMCIFSLFILMIIIGNVVTGGVKTYEDSVWIIATTSLCVILFLISFSFACEELGFELTQPDFPANLETY